MQTVYGAVGGADGLLPRQCIAFIPSKAAGSPPNWAEALGGQTTYSHLCGDETSVVVQMHSGSDRHDEVDHSAITCRCCSPSRAP